MNHSYPQPGDLVLWVRRHDEPFVFPAFVLRVNAHDDSLELLALTGTGLYNPSRVLPLEKAALPHARELRSEGWWKPHPLYEGSRE
ncbi:MAG TPA: hypothetical protein VNK04_03965 [Gemmataceae bacterium]|nr:hypothetical protein [Gemmataceae bacterium]